MLWAVGEKEASRVDLEAILGESEEGNVKKQSWFGVCETNQQQDKLENFSEFFLRIWGKSF